MLIQRHLTILTNFNMKTPRRIYLQGALKAIYRVNYKVILQYRKVPILSDEAHLSDEVSCRMKKNN